LCFRYQTFQATKSVVSLSLKGGSLIEDFQAIQAVLQGDREAYAGLVRAYHVRILSYCQTMLLDKDEAEDAAQDVFVKGFASLRQYKRDLSFSGWLYRIASNHCLDLLRKRKRQKTDSLDGLMDQKGEPIYPLAPGTADTGPTALERGESVEFAMRVLSYLPADQREILVLRELDGLSYEEICSVLDCSLNAVKARLRRARLHLQEKARHFLGEKSFKQ
jgi:RNA polymerase sigma-70 factor (ECF subfamily)